MTLTWLLWLPCKVINIEALLRRCWNKSEYLSGNRATEGDKKRPFLLADDGSKAHVGRIAALMRSDFDWAVIALIARVSQDAERPGQWAENCPCSKFIKGGHVH